ncbi:hypothetical protein CALCODRAFT_493566 [Calocera cornea HHB12733]|uniref:Uncharacterized protein n=1 Tax=Calocera cornea HHB12733 TaxID=1353952 RepID=A0A165HKU5_9BASI|nr:hypothetical protein CALCODRAFT_493566 [Calocera cornea HHB12733]
MLWLEMWIRLLGTLWCQLLALGTIPRRFRASGPPRKPLVKSTCAHTSAQRAPQNALQTPDFNQQPGSQDQYQYQYQAVLTGP